MCPDPMRLDDVLTVLVITAEDLGGHDPAVQYGPPHSDYTIDIERLARAFGFGRGEEP